MKPKVAIVFFFVFFLFACTHTHSPAGGVPEQTEEATFTIETWRDLEALLNSDNPPLLIDARTQAEYNAGHIPGAILLPHTEVKDNPPNVAKDHPIVLYCTNGPRAGTGLNALQRLGYTNVVNFRKLSLWEGELNYGPDP